MTLAPPQLGPIVRISGRSCPRRTPSVFTTVHRNSVLIRRPCRSFATSIRRFVARTTGSPGILTVGVALCHASNSSPVIGTLVDTTTGHGRIITLIRLGTQFSRTGGVI